VYQKLYKQIIDQAKHENRQKHKGIYYEAHHIVPEFMFKKRQRKGPIGHLDGDPNHIDNLVLLTFQEHLMCHYYLYEMHKNDQYAYQAGSALQFFFTHSGNNHTRQRELTEVDQKFLDEMSYLRQRGIESISKARKGTMPVVDAKTRQSIGSVSVQHPKVLSGEWVHHSKGKPGHRNGKSQKGSNNNNYKGPTEEQRTRVIGCVPKAIIDNQYVVKSKLLAAIKLELPEFKKLSHVWLRNHFGGVHKLVNEYNEQHNTNLIYNPWYRSSIIKQKLSSKSASYCWVTDGKINVRLTQNQLDNYLSIHKQFRRGRTI
jgi:hypothetical protein